MTMRLFVVAISIVVCGYFPAHGADVFLRNGDSVGVRNPMLISSPLVAGMPATASRELVFELCAGDPALVLPTGGLAVKACPPGAPPVPCTPLATMPVPRLPFGACVPYTCSYTLLVPDDPRDTSTEESLSPLDIRITGTPTQADQTVVDQAEYNMLLGLGKRPQKGYLESRDADRSATLMTVKETVRHDDLTVPDTDPEIFADGFESGDTSVWRSSSPTDPCDVATCP